MLIITSIGCWKISRKKDDIIRRDKESILGTEDVVNAEEKDKEDQYANIPLVYWDISEIRTYYRFESNLEKRDTAAVIGIEWDYENAKKDTCKPPLEK